MRVLKIVGLVGVALVILGMVWGIARPPRKSEKPKRIPPGTLNPYSNLDDMERALGPIPRHNSITDLPPEQRRLDDKVHYGGNPWRFTQ